MLTPQTLRLDYVVDTRRFFAVIRMIDVTKTSNLVMFGEFCVKTAFSIHCGRKRCATSFLVGMTYAP